MHICQWTKDHQVAITAQVEKPGETLLPGTPPTSLHPAPPLSYSPITLSQVTPRLVPWGKVANSQV